MGPHSIHYIEDSDDYQEKISYPIRHQSYAKTLPKVIGRVRQKSHQNTACPYDYISHRSCALQKSKAGLSSQGPRQLLQWWRIEVVWSFLTPNFHKCWQPPWFWQIAWYWSVSFLALKQVCSLR